MFVARRISADNAAWIRSAPVTTALTDLVKITDGALVITVGAETKTVANLDLSTAKSLSVVANLLATAISGVNRAVHPRLCREFAPFSNREGLTFPRRIPKLILSTESVAFSVTAPVPLSGRPNKPADASGA